MGAKQKIAEDLEFPMPQKEQNSVVSNLLGHRPFARIAVRVAAFVLSGIQAVQTNLETFKMAISTEFELDRR